MPDGAGGRDDLRDWLVARSGGGDAQMAPLEDVLPLHSAALYQTLRGTLHADSAGAPVLARARILVAPGDFASRSMETRTRAPWRVRSPP
jgi:hypothetical protein